MSQNVVVNDVLVSEVYVNESGLQQTAVSRRFWLCTAITGTPTFTLVAAYLDNLFAPLIKPIIVNSATYLGTRVRRVFPNTLDTWSAVAAHAGVGTAGAVGLPAQSCGLGEFYSAKIGKPNQGRIYLPFPSASSNTGAGVPSAGYITDALAYVTEFSNTQNAGTGGNVATLVSVLWKASAPTFTTQIITVNLATSWATQRRRGGFGRFNRPPF